MPSPDPAAVPVAQPFSEPVDPAVAGALPDDNGLEKGTALCLSGGGYRAMVFHLGVLIRLNETGHLSRLQRVSSVSGGSITAGYLGLKWKTLRWDADGVAENLYKEVIDPVRKFAGESIDAESVIGGILNPFSSVSDNIARAYRKHLFKDATLQDLPGTGEGPRFVINATNVQSGALWRFSRPYMGDYKVGLARDPAFLLATAVTASSAFPPVLSPVELDVSKYRFEAAPGTTLNRPPYTTKLYLSDGGVYDNMGLETVWKRYRTLLVSDAGAPFQPEESPKEDWARHSIRVLGLIDSQVRSLRRIALVEALQSKEKHDGAYWNISTSISKYPKPGALSCPEERTHALATTPTRLAAMEEELQERLINWGYAITAAALESYHTVPVVKEATFPYARGV